MKMVAKKIEQYKLPDGVSDEVKDMLISDLFIFGRYIYHELDDGSIVRIDPRTEITEEV